MGLPSFGVVESLISIAMVLAVPIGIGILVITLLYRLPWAPYTGPARDRQASALLAIFLGTVGAHKWYLRRPWEAILYCVFFWTFIPTVLGVMEGIWYLSLSDDEFRARVVERRPDADTIDPARWFTREARDAAPPAGSPGMPPGWDLCAACRTLNPLDARFCLRCGARIQGRSAGSADVYTGPPCPSCGLPTVVGADRCTDCGATLAPAPAPAPAG